MTLAIEWHGPAGSDRYTPGRGGTPIDRIVMHTMVGWISQADATFKGGSRLVSAHYGVRVDGTIWQWVDEKDTAWQAGDWGMNQRSIGIEHEDAGLPDAPRTPQQIAASVQLVRDICTRYSLPINRTTIRKHSEVVATHCPGSLPVDDIVTQALGVVPVVNEDPLPVLFDTNLVRYAKSVNSAIDLSIPRLYSALAPQAGILPEVAFAQALKETANFNFGGTALPEWHNPAGLGVTGAPGVGNIFPDWETGIRAHLGHLLWYFGPHRPEFCQYDQRHFGGHKNLPNDLRQLNGKWAIPGTNYGQSIDAIAKQIRSA